MERSRLASREELADGGKAGLQVRLPQGAGDGDGLGGDARVHAQSRLGAEFPEHPHEPPEASAEARVAAQLAPDRNWSARRRRKIVPPTRTATAPAISIESPAAQPAAPASEAPASNGNAQQATHAPARPSAP
jgi:hypothetical protein